MPYHGAHWAPPYVPRSTPRRLLAACNSAFERVLVGGLYRAGLRVGECCALRWDAIHLDGEPPMLDVSLHWSRDRRTLRPGGKGDKPGTVPITPAFAEDLRQLHASSTGQWVLPSPRKADRPITTWYAWSTLRAIATRAGLDPDQIHPHALRHATASHMADEDKPLALIQAYMRHADPATTSIYIQTAMGKLAKAGDALE